MIYDQLDTTGQTAYRNRLDIRARSICSEIENLSPKFKASVVRHLSCLLSSNQQNKDFQYVELSVGFIAKGAGVAFETSRRAWHWLKDRIGFLTIHIDIARRLGFRIRRRSAGGLWGQHLVLHDVSRKILGYVSDFLKIAPAGRLRQWKEVLPEKAGSNWMCRCPFHDDHRPSMLLNWNSDMASGSAVCFACRGADGSYLTAYWVKEDSKFMMSLSSRSQGSSCDNLNQYNIKTYKPHGQDKASQYKTFGRVQNSDLANSLKGTACLSTLDVPKRKARTSRSKSVIYRINGNSAKKSVASLHLLESVRRHEARSLTDSAMYEALFELSTTDRVTDRFITVDDMVPREYREMSKGDRKWYVPTSWKPDTSSFLLVDLDKFEHAPMSHSAGELVDKMTESHPYLEPGCLIVRTSHLGAQVLLKLKSSFSARANWMSSEWGRSFIDEIDSKVLSAFHGSGFVGGYADKMVHTVGRNMRLPGYRLDKNECLYRSHIEHDSI